jgi:hypothetical protein
VIVAKKALTLRELRVACSIYEVGPAEYRWVGEGNDIRRTIHQKCGFILELDNLDRVTFFHQTAQEFLVEQRSVRVAEKAPAHGR